MGFSFETRYYTKTYTRRSTQLINFHTAVLTIRRKHVISCHSMTVSVHRASRRRLCQYEDAQYRTNATDHVLSDGTKLG
jgi:hypothetical protein